MRHGLLLGIALVSTVVVFAGIQVLVYQITPHSDQAIPAPDNQPAAIVAPSPLPLGRHFMIGHWAETPVASTTALLTEHQLGGIIIMSAPADPVDIKAWTQIWQAAVPYPLMIAIDQEGGEVSRLRGEDFTTTGQRTITTEADAYALGLARGQELNALGITMNFAPVLDTATKPNSFLYNRVFSQSPVLLAAALARGHREAGVTPVVKHFPGHPDTAHDSHLTLPVVSITPAEQANFIRPFAEYIKDAEPAALMTAHVSFPLIDTLPATLSPYWLSTVLRQELGYAGLIITDDMSMDAIDNNWTSTEASQMALEAGADIILFAAEPTMITDTLHTLAKEKIDIPDSDKRVRWYTDE